ncbi:hypothetical protein CONPUDRAFT_147050 [Coniophora puteana RWD-64-598 SS2]|uniref:UBX domain-containing protein n=1 Tax=Coniophora puteana (strain RWD-64-598) TaxID=741705 RepID=A0A5M3MB31_CONPW|nr:uncharacterized protein CONPUDRAFT_147050 [Coniophora puteana RWD-64-598 SS2]EIW76010.1 hypothetical protein CONPUDRAFT_147050 [Coniophora puteana RWD-64-598 SS2]
MWQAVVSLLSLPFRVLSSIFRFVFGALHIPVPTFRLLTPFRPHQRFLHPRDAAEQWVRSLEEETGAISLRGLARDGDGQASGVEERGSAVKRGVNSYPPIPRDGDPSGSGVLPEFYLGSYEEVLKACQTEGRIGCIILVSEEHDDVAEFKRSTLTDPTFVRLLTDNNFVVWGGDVRDREAWAASQKLQATTYPFVAFVGLQPRRSHPHSSTNSSQSTPLLSVLSRHQGPASPASAPTSSETLMSHLETQLLPRVQPFLTRHQASIRQRERDRMIRAEQDRMYEDGLRRDRERVEQARAEKAAEADRAVREAEEIARQEEEAAIQESLRELRERTRMDWRRWMRAKLVPATTDSAVSPTRDKENVRIAIRLPSNARLVQSFPRSTSLTTLYALVDASMVPEDLLPTSDPSEAPAKGVADIETFEQYLSTKGFLEGTPNIDGDDSVDEWWGFRLALSYPRKEILWAPCQSLGEVDGLAGGAQVVVERIIKGGTSTSSNGARSGATSPKQASEAEAGPASDDEYESESD